MCLRKSILFVATFVLLMCTGQAIADPNANASPDFDEDGVVDIPDFLIFVDRFGSSRGDETFEAKYDLDGNGVVGIPDFLIFMDNFGKEVPPSGDDEVVVIPDAYLRAAIETALGKASGATITRGDMAALTHLEAENSNISDLIGLEFAICLTRLDLGYEIVERRAVNSNAITDLSPLSGLTSLTRLRLYTNNISNISVLSEMTSLTGLDLTRNSISDISALSGLTSLEWLRLGDNSISDISALSGLSSLERLVLHNNNIFDISELSGLTSLTWINLHDNYISDLSALSGMISLTWISLYNNWVSDISPLVANTGLGSGDEVELRNNPLSDTSIYTHIPVFQSRGVTVNYGAF